MKDKKKTPMEKLTAGYEKFIAGKQVNNNGKEQFNKVVKNAAKKKIK